ncbi:hypothetical protein OSTOST_03606 [Ostertagia ostertagi]
MRYTGSYAPGSYRRKVRKKSVRPCVQGSSRLRSRRDDQGRAERAEKTSNEAPLALRRMPIVVIPRKRKYKNYVSRRRNTHLLASLRKCVSDPHMYRSFNHWKGLWREFSPIGELTSPSADIPRLIDEEDSPRTPVVTTVVVAPTVDARRSPLFKHVSEKITQMKKNELSQVSLRIPHPPGKAINIPGRRPFRKGSPPKTALMCSIANSSKKQALDTENRVEGHNNNHSEKKDNKVGSSVEATAVKSPVLPALEKSGAPSPASFPKASPESFGDKPVVTTNKKTKDPSNFFFVEPAPSEQWKFAAATPSAPKVLRKAYGSRSGTTICAIGSSLTAASANNVNTEDNTQRVIEKKVTLRKRMEQAKETAAVPIPSKCQMDIGEKSSQADEQKAKKTVNAIAAAFSTQSVSVDVPENANMEEKKEVEKDAAIQQVPVKSVTSTTANLLAQLQLPPTVSAKVDKIIASGQKSRLQKLNDQRARMKAHLDRQVTGVLPDDDDGHLIFKKNDILHGRWELREELGEGTFGRVVKAYDKQRDKMRAVKIVRNVHKYRDAAYLEIKVLTKLKQLDPNGTQ